jgi:hypothetical protein
MPPQYKVKNPIPTPTTFADTRVRRNTLEVTLNAEEGSVATSSIVVDDPSGDFDIVGHRDFAIRETEVTSGQSYIFFGAVADRKVRRGPSGRVGVGREWEVSLVDLNTLLDRRIMVGTDNNRPAETDVHRIQWLLTTSEGAFIADTRYFSTSSPVAMDAVDYRGQSLKQVLDDCAQQSGKDYWLTSFEDTGTTSAPWGVASLWYGFRSSSLYPSTLVLSNVAADVAADQLGLTYAYSQEETFLTRDPSRVYSSVYVQYDGGTAYVNNLATQAAFARRDAVSPAENVKTAAKAQARGTRYLNDIDTEEDVITTSIEVPLAHVNLLREGMAVSFKATHLPGYETGAAVRVLNRTVSQHSEQTYKIRMELGSGGSDATDHTGETIGGYLCSANGYIVPTAGVVDPNGILHCSTFPNGGGRYVGNSNTDFGKYIVVYAETTYMVHTYNVIHGPAAAPIFIGLGGLSIYQINLGDDEPGFGVPELFEYTGTFTTAGTYASDPAPRNLECYLIELPWTGHNDNDSEHYTVVTYVSGKDPRFSGLVGCPFG